MKSTTRAHVRTAAMLATTSTCSASEAQQPTARQAEPAAAPSPLEAAAGFTDLVRFGRELQEELKRIREEYPPAAPLKAELLEFGEGMKFRHADHEAWLKSLEQKMEELQACTQLQLAGPRAELSQELERVRDEYPTAKDVEEGLTRLFGHPSGRVTRLEGRVGGMDERMTVLALRLQALEDAKPTAAAPRSSSSKKSIAK
ncbi:hypothetical protein [Archangium violaceum]|uniref:Uncharacterized protein n=1 Tax=Archangium violaceum Cb vi76 TaxID=1406225 RepID=A0A084SE09_9BACT|nr:hypothetical protein [Archangium violaceum]KFA86694.1 hypothetical protein Q664_52735 [Archangium violaceum Cb vi76]